MAAKPPPPVGTVSQLTQPEVEEKLRTAEEAAWKELTDIFIPWNISMDVIAGQHFYTKGGWTIHRHEFTGVFRIKHRSGKVGYYSGPAAFFMFK